MCKYILLTTFIINSVNYINWNIIEFLINKVLDVKTARTLLIKDYANSLTNTILGKLLEIGIIMTFTGGSRSERRYETAET